MTSRLDRLVVEARALDVPWDVERASRVRSGARTRGEARARKARALRRGAGVALGAGMALFALFRAAPASPSSEVAVVDTPASTTPPIAARVHDDAGYGRD